MLDRSQYNHPLDFLKAVAQQYGLPITSTTGGHHNVGSKHYLGLAIDVDNRKMTADKLNQIRGLGLKVLDETTRPKGQAVWGGPHFHIEYLTQPQMLASHLVASMMPLTGQAQLPPVDLSSLQPPAPQIPEQQATQSLVDGQWFSPDQWNQFTV